MSGPLPSIHVQDLIEVCAEFRLLLYAYIDLDFAQQNQQACTKLLRLSQICGNKKQFIYVVYLGYPAAPRVVESLPIRISKYPKVI